MRLWSDADSRRHLSPHALSEAMLRFHLPQAGASATPGTNSGVHLLTEAGAGGGGAGLDLVAVGIHAIGRLFEHGS